MISLKRKLLGLVFMNVVAEAATGAAAPAAAAPIVAAPAAAAAPAAGSPEAVAASATAALLGAAATPATGAAAIAAPAAAPAADAKWFDSFTNPELKTWLGAKGFKDAGAVAESAWNLEKLFGHDKAGRTLVIPGEGAPAEEVAAFRERLGVPKAAEDYKLPASTILDSAETSKWLLEAGIPVEAGQKLAAAAEAHQAKMQADSEAAFKVQSTNEMAALTKDWGGAYEQKMEQARRAATEFLPGKDKAERQAFMVKVEHFMGTDKMLRMLQNMGAKLGEHSLINSEDGGGDGAILSPAEAKAAIDKLKADKVWAAAYTGGGVKENAQLQRLLAMQFPEQK